MKTIPKTPDQALLDLARDPLAGPDEFALRLRALLEEGASLSARDDEGRDALMVAAARSEGAAKVDALLAAGAPVDSVDESFNSALHHASSAGNFAAIASLIAGGAYPEARNRLGATPLHLCAQADCPEGILRLAREGVDLEPVDNTGRTPLQRASDSREPRPAAVGALLQAGVDVRAATAEGEEALVWAATHSLVGRVAALAGADGVERIMERGDELLRENLPGAIRRHLPLDFTAPSAGGITGLHEAARHGEVDALGFFLSLGMNVAARDDTQRSALSHAAESANPASPEAIKTLLFAGAPVDDQGDGRYQTPLMRACRLDRARNVAALLAGGANPSIGDDQEVAATAADYAAAAGSVAALRVLRERGVPMGPRRGQQDWPLIAAARHNRLDAVRYLLGEGESVDAPGVDRRAALSYASSNGNAPMVGALLDAKADPNLVDANGLSALLWAALRDEGEAASLLVERGARVDAGDHRGVTALSVFVSRGQADAASAMLRLGADPNRLDNERQSPLGRAAQAKDVAMTRALLAAKADPLYADEQGWTPLAHAAHTPGAEDCLEAMLSATGENLGPLAPRGRNLLHLAASHARPSTIERLARAGAALNALSEAGFTPLQLASQAGNHRAARALLRQGADPEVVSIDGTKAFHFASYALDAETPEQRSGGRAALRALTPLLKDVNKLDVKGQAPLHYVAALGEAEAVSALIARQADVKLRSARGATPLSLAIGAALNRGAPGRSSQIPMDAIAALLAAGSDANAAGAEGLLPLQQVARSTSRKPPAGSPFADGREELCAALIAHGADPTIPAARHALREAGIDVEKVVAVARERAANALASAPANETAPAPTETPAKRPRPDRAKGRGPAL